MLSPSTTSSLPSLLPHSIHWQLPLQICFIPSSCAASHFPLLPAALPPSPSSSPHTSLHSLLPRHLAFSSFSRASTSAFSRDVEAFEREQAGLLRQLAERDPEQLIRVFERSPGLHNRPAALSAYVKALVKVDRLDSSSLLLALQRGARGERGGGVVQKP